MEPSASASPISSAVPSGTGVAGSGVVGAPRGSDGREKFSAEELAIVLSHFDIGIIDSVVEFPRGSRKAPKLVLVTDQGKYLLKRRARGRDDAFKVAFCHGLQLHLASKQFPLPHLIGTRRDNNSMMQWRGAIYELFEYIPGQGYPQTLEATFEAGRALSLYHKLLEEYHSEWNPPTGSYHMAPSVETAMRAIPTTLSQYGGEVQKTCNYLLESYYHAAEVVEQLGIENWPRQIVHGDWHPGNMLFRDNRVVAVIDYDSARVLPRIVDIANGALQFSIIGGDENVTKWPNYPDETRFKRYLKGYDEVVLLSEGEIATIPWLMVEALIAEAVFPVATNGQFGRMNGWDFLNMVARKVAWLQANAQRLIDLATA